MARIIAHIDLNAFFARCEELRDPSLSSIPVIVGHEGRSGIVSTCNYEARKYGIHSGQPTFQAIKLCPNVKIVHPDYSYYQMMSTSFFAFIKNYSKTIEAASIDECYADMSEAVAKEKDPIAFFLSIQNRLLEETGLKCSIGVAPTKWLAKMASDMKKPMGLTILRRKDIPSKIYPLPIESFWGIGKKTAPRLRQMGIATIGDLAKQLEEDETHLRKEFGKFYDTVNEWVHGRGSDEIDTEPFDPKSIGNSETLMMDASSFGEIETVVKRLCDEVSSRAISSHKVGSTITLQVKDIAFKAHSKAVSLETPTSSFMTIYDRVCSLYRKHFEGMSIRLVGVTLSKLVDPIRQSVQMNLWNYEAYEEMDRTKLLINEMNRRFDKPVLMRGSEAKKKHEH